jgi:hypothetical protein
VFATIAPALQNSPDHVVEERGHGRIKQWETWTVDAAGIDFPHIQQLACIRRDEFTLGGARISKEQAWIVTSSDTATATDIHTHVRDTTWHDDAQQTYTGSGPQVMATFRNAAASLLRLNNFSRIEKTTEWIARDRNRALPLLATQSHSRNPE